MSDRKPSNDLKQGSREWLNYRKGGIGASDAPAVMGESPWNTRFELWAYKTDRLQPPDSHPIAVAAMQRGQKLEPVARALYIERTGIQVEPANFEHPEFPFMRASLDGWNQDSKHILELKAPGKKDLAEARKGKIPKKYYWQLVQQMACADAETCDYVTFDGEDELTIIPFQRDKKAEKQLIEAVSQFWDLVQTNTPPDVDHNDLDRLVQRLKTEQERVAKSMDALYLLNDCLLKGSSGF